MLSEQEYKDMLGLKQECDKLKEELTLILSQVVNFDNLFEVQVMARAHAMRLGIKIVEKDSK
jgi:hypothetical protein